MRYHNRRDPIQLFFLSQIELKGLPRKSPYIWLRFLTDLYRE